MNEIPAASIALLRHYLAGLAFRFVHVTRAAPDGFAQFVAGPEVRSPTAIVTHMTGLVRLAHDQFEPLPEAQLAPLDWEGERLRFLRAVAKLHVQLGSTGTLHSARRIPTLEQVLHGPLADVMTHVGQLALLRRLAGAPVEAVSYWRAEPREPALLAESLAAANGAAREPDD